MSSCLPPQPAYPADLLLRAARIRLACFDVDGTLTDGRLIYQADGSELKAFQVLDGLGLRLLEDHGIAVALITARSSRVVAERANELRLSHVFQGVKDKAEQLRSLCATRGLSLEQTAFFGDDLPDLPALRLAGLAAGPANAHPWLDPFLHWRTPLHGGQGAARQLCDLILESQGLRTAVLERFGA